MKKNLILIMALLIAIFANGCNGTSKGVKEDTAKGAEWSKDKVNDGAKYIEKKTD
jgi:predicted small secreted protein